MAYFAVEEQFVIANAFFPEVSFLGESLGEVGDQYVMKPEEKNGDYHVLPLHLARYQEHCENQQSICDEEWSDELAELEIVVDESFPQLAPHERVGHHELNEGSNQEEDRTN